MKQNRASSRYIIHPEKQEELLFWADKWGITVNDLTNAIIDTGYVNTNDLKAYFRKKGLLMFSVRRLIRNMVITMQTKGF